MTSTHQFTPSERAEAGHHAANVAQAQAASRNTFSKLTNAAMSGVLTNSSDWNSLFQNHQSALSILDRVTADEAFWWASKGYVI